MNNNIIYFLKTTNFWSSDFFHKFGKVIYSVGDRNAQFIPNLEKYTAFLWFDPRAMHATADE